MLFTYQIIIYIIALYSFNVELGRNIQKEQTQLLSFSE